MEPRAAITALPQTQKSLPVHPWHLLPRWKRRLHGFFTYQLAALAALFYPESADMAMHDTLEEQLNSKYWELIYAVRNKVKGETRHETALRYIVEAEQASSVGAGSESDGGSGFSQSPPGTTKIKEEE